MMTLTEKPARVALLRHGDCEARKTATLDGDRLGPLADALRAAGVTAELVVYNDDCAEEVREQLAGVDGVLVWVNPIENGRDRSRLDALLREVADTGVMVSAHPDVIQKMGTKDVLVRTRDMSWGTETYSRLM